MKSFGSDDQNPIDPDSHEKLARYTEKLSTYTALLAIAVIVLIVATTTTIYLTYKASGEIQSQIEIESKTLKGVERQAAEAEKANVNAKAAIELASKNAADIANASRASQRAYLVVNGFGLDNSAPRLGYRNVGQTPAYQVRSDRRRFLISPADFNTHKYIEDTPDHKCISDEADTIASQETKATWIFTTDPYAKTKIPDFTKEELARFGEGNLYYVISGKICYRDIFHAEHYTIYCYYYRNGNLDTHYFCNPGEFD